MLETIALVAMLATDTQVFVPKHLSFDGIVLEHAALVWKYESAGEPQYVRGQMPALIASAGREWSDVCPVHFARTNRRMQPNATIRWTQPGELPAAFAAWANLSVNERGFISHVDIRLDPAKFYHADHVRVLLRHELGHAIGVAHSDVEGGVMSGPPYSTYAFPNTLQADDIAGCNDLYH
jgi:hypothetical protein